MFSDPMVQDNPWQKPSCLTQAGATRYAPAAHPSPVVQFAGNSGSAGFASVAASPARDASLAQDPIFALHAVGPLKVRK